MATSQNATSNLFSQLYNDKEGKVINEQNKNLTERSLQRKYQSAYDDAIGKMDELRGKINTERTKLSSGSLQIIINLNAEIDAYERSANIVAEEYKVLFGEDIKK